MEYGLKRTERIEVRVSPDELKVFEEMAKKYDVTVSDYLRWMGMWAAIKKANPLALKMLRELLSLEAQRVRDRFYEAVGLPSIRKSKRCMHFMTRDVDWRPWIHVLIATMPCGAGCGRIGGKWFACRSCHVARCIG